RGQSEDAQGLVVLGGNDHDIQFGDHAAIVPVFKNPANFGRVRVILLRGRGDKAIYNQFALDHWEFAAARQHDSDWVKHELAVILDPVSDNKQVKDFSEHLSQIDVRDRWLRRM